MERPPAWGGPVLGGPAWGSPILGGPALGSLVLGGPAWGSPVFGSIFSLVRRVVFVGGFWSASVHPSQPLGWTPASALALRVFGPKERAVFVGGFWPRRVKLNKNSSSENELKDLSHTLEYDQPECHHAEQKR